MSLPGEDTERILDTYSATAPSETAVRAGAGRLQVRRREEPPTRQGLLAMKVSEHRGYCISFLLQKVQTLRSRWMESGASGLKTDILRSPHTLSFLKTHLSIFVPSPVLRSRREAQAPPWAPETAGRIVCGFWGGGEEEAEPAGDSCLP